MKKPAFLVAGIKSGSGKTLVTLGIMAALHRRGMLVQPYKCGPDYIDPTLHLLVTGRTSSNLDLKMCGEPFCREIFARRLLQADIGVVEGVMGLFDGAEGSSASLAKKMDLPVILVIDVRSAAQSISPIVYGFESYDRDVNIIGVVFNFVGSDRHKQLIADEVKARCKTPVLGFLPRDERFKIPGRHLGLHMADEVAHQLNFDDIAEQIEMYIDVDSIVRASTHHLDTIPEQKGKIALAKKRRVKLAVARDEAFCFYYQDNLDMLEHAGITIVYFSPVHDSCLPEDVDGVYLGGGYPELYAEKLAANISMRESVKRYSTDGGFVYGECGGFMYLCDTLMTDDGKEHPMSGIFNNRIRMDRRLRKLGYREVTINSDCLLGRKGELRFGHEFHYSDEEKVDFTLPPLFNDANETYGVMTDNSYGSYVHLHFGKTPEIADRMYTILQVYKDS